MAYEQERSPAELTRNVVALERAMREHKATHVSREGFDFLTQQVREMRQELQTDREDQADREEARTKERKGLWAAVWIAVLAAVMAFAGNLIFFVLTHHP